MKLFLIFLIFLISYLPQILGKEPWNDNTDADFVIVGAGAAGCAVAARLSEDGRYKVLLLEAGGEPEVLNDIPYFGAGPFSGKLDWDFSSEVQKQSCLGLKDEKCPVHLGRGLGGSTLISGMVYTRGNKRDYDYWKSLGNDGWGYEDVSAVFKKFEDFQGDISNRSVLVQHSGGSPLTVSTSPFNPDLTPIFLDAGRELGYDEVALNESRYKGFSRGYFTLKNGHRLSNYKAYLERNRTRNNCLHVVINALVSKVEFDNDKRATGVIYEKDGTQYTAKAKKEVILSAGTVHSPQILSLSGIGPKKNLNELQIPIINDLPGVGQNYRDHVLVQGLMITLNKHIGFLINRDLTAENFEKLEVTGEGPLTVPQRLLVTSFLDSDDANKNLDWPDLELIFFQGYPKRYLKEDYNFKEEQYFGKNVITAKLFLLRPKSVGYLTIQSKNPKVQPIINPNYLGEKEDIKKLVSGIKAFKKIASTQTLQKFGAILNFNSNLKGCEKFEFMSDDYFECFVRYYSSSGNHISGTCKMGPKSDPNAVVDNELRVHGVSNLRVVDNSICPTSISGHTMSSATMIGEKAAINILQYWSNQKQ